MSAEFKAMLERHLALRASFAASDIFMIAA
jgi:hypothetical protein